MKLAFIINFIKKEPVFIVATVLAVISSFITFPSIAFQAIDFSTLALLLALMLVVQGLKSCGLFDRLVAVVNRHVKNQRSLCLTMVVLCFFSSMLITNDVALITFVPFTILLFPSIRSERIRIYLIVLETIAANLGSMLTPIGNPQNLYLYSVSGITLGNFILLMLPYAAVSLILLAGACLILRPEPLSQGAFGTKETSSKSAFSKTKETSEKSTVSGGQKNFISLICYCILFFVCLLTVLRLLDYRIMLAIVVAAILFIDRRLFRRADYVLLLTFISFFIFIGNMKSLPQISDFLSSMITGRECIVSVLASQVVSNVPAAMLLSGFTTRYELLIIGTNLGGLGTLIASMASLISYKFYAAQKESNSGRYLFLFTLVNILFLIVLMALYALLT